jgi:hypothetical protein
MTSTEENYLVWLRRDPTTGIVVGETWSEKDPPRGYPRLHRLHGPAMIGRDTTTGVVIHEEWYRHGKLHRDDGPAIIRRTPDGKVKYTSWYRDDQLIPYRQRPKPARALKPPRLQR